MKYRKLDKNGDYSFGNNKFDYASYPNSVALAIRGKLLLFYGEWWEDIGIGIPMFQSFLGQVNRPSLIGGLQRLLEKRVMEVPGVKSVSEIIVKENNKRTYNISIKCILLDEQEISVEVDV